MMNAITPITEDSALNAVNMLHNIVLKLTDQAFKEGIDYGQIPGTGNRKTLLQPGMEKLLRALRLRPEYHLLTSLEDFDTPRFHYRYECRLTEIDTGLVIGTAIGSCNSMESKYRWRHGDRKCPHCGKETIIKGKQEYGGGWICFAKKGGCGAKFADHDAAITEQPAGRIENADIFDQVNTLDKMAQKRALGSAIKTVANVSEWFTVDLDDMVAHDVIETETIVVRRETDDSPATTPIAKPEVKQSNGQTWLVGKERADYVAHLKDLGLTWNDVRMELVSGTELITLNDITLDRETLYARTDELAAALIKPATPKNGSGNNETAAPNPTDDKSTDKRHFIIQDGWLKMINRKFAEPTDPAIREVLELNQGDTFYITAIQEKSTIKNGRWIATASYQGNGKKLETKITLWPEHKRAIERAGYEFALGKVEIPVTINWSQGNGWEIENVLLADALVQQGVTA